MTLEAKKIPDEAFQQDKAAALLTAQCLDPAGRSAGLWRLGKDCGGDLGAGHEGPFTS